MIIKTSIIEELQTKGFIIYKVQGRSMEPMLLPNRDIVTIKKIDNPNLSENDVVLFQKNGKLILHRIIEVKSDGTFTILGDNCSIKDEGITKEEIIGKLITFIHNGARYNITDPIYLQYVKILRQTEKSRMIKKRIIDSVSWHLRYLPPNILSNIKQFLKKILKYQLYFANERI